MYKITGIDLIYRQPEGKTPADGLVAVCTVHIEREGESQPVVISLNEADVRQIGNLLRQKIDKKLNGE